MSRSLPLRRALALSSALVLTSWGTLALPAAADPGHGKSAGHGQAKKSHGTSGQHSSQKGGSGQSAKPHAAKPQAAKPHPTKPQAAKPTPSKPAPTPSQASNGHHGSTGNGKPSGTGKPSGSKDGGKGSPAGNNGTVKIAPLGEMDGIPQNSPHPGCTFQVEWYGFEEGSDIVSTVSFAMHAPTADVGLTVSGPSSVFVGGDPASGAGTATGLDGQQAYTLSFDGAPHPKQGYHVKLTVSTPRSNGNDTKTKVFWVQPCEDETTTPGDDDTTTPPGDDDDTTTPGDDDTTGDSTEDTTGDSTEDETGTGSAQAGSSVGNNSGASVPTAVDAGEQNPVVDFVTSPVPLVAIALGALLTAGAFVTRRRAGAGR